MRNLLGDESAASLERVSELAKMMEEQGLIQNKEGRLELTPRGLAASGSAGPGRSLLEAQPDKLGNHDIEQSGTGHERNFDTKPYEFGDPFNLTHRANRSQRHPARRRGHPGPADPG